MSPDRRGRGFVAFTFYIASPDATGSNRCCTAPGDSNEEDGNPLVGGADLRDPKWKGRIAFTDPARSGSGYATVTTLVGSWDGGGDAGLQKVGELFRNLEVLNRSSLVLRGVGNGEHPLGMSSGCAGPVWAADLVVPVAANEEITPLRLATLGSGRDDG